MPLEGLQEVPDFVSEEGCRILGEGTLSGDAPPVFHECVPGLDGIQFREDDNTQVEVFDDALVVLLEELDFMKLFLKTGVEEGVLHGQPQGGGHTVYQFPFFKGDAAAVLFGSKGKEANQWASLGSERHELMKTAVHEDFIFIGESELEVLCTVKGQCLASLKLQDKARAQVERLFFRKHLELVVTEMNQEGTGLKVQTLVGGVENPFGQDIQIPLLHQHPGQIGQAFLE